MRAVVDISVANLINVVLGTSIAWSTPMLYRLQHADTSPFNYALTIEETSWISGMLAIGAMVGPYIYGFLANKIGRKYTLLICAVPFLISFFVFALATVPVLFYIGRFVMGTCIGGVFTVMPMYIGEVAEASNRGALGSSMNCFICFGFFFSHAAGSFLTILTFNLLLMVFPVIFIVLFWIIGSETPTYYIMKKQYDKAKTTLQKIRTDDEETIEKKINEMVEKAKESESARFCEVFGSKGSIKAFLITVGLLAFQQLSGINAVLFYAYQIFQHAGSSLEPKICSIIIGSMQFITSFVTPFVVDQIGRKILLVVSAVGIIFSEVLLATYCMLYEKRVDVDNIGILPMVCLSGYIIAFNLGLAILPWSMMGELFSDRIKCAASSAATSITWFIGFFIAKYFEPLQAVIGMGGAYFIFTGFCVLLIPFTAFYVIETKGKTLQEIQDVLKA